MSIFFSLMLQEFEGILKMNNSGQMSQDTPIPSLVKAG